MLRLNQDDYFMGQVHPAAARGTCDRLRVGAVLVQDGESIATGYNGAPRKERHCDHKACQVCGEAYSDKGWEVRGYDDTIEFKGCPRCGSTADAEEHRMHRVYAPDGSEKSQHCTLTVHAELNALLNAGRKQAKGATLYVTHSPCWECAKAIVTSGVQRIVFERLYQKREALWLLARHCELVQWRKMGPLTWHGDRTRCVTMPEIHKHRSGFQRKGEGIQRLSSITVSELLQEPEWLLPKSGRELVFPMPEDGILTDELLGLKGTAYEGTVYATTNEQGSDGHFYSKNVKLPAYAYNVHDMTDENQKDQSFPRIRLHFSPDGFIVTAWEGTWSTM